MCESTGAEGEMASEFAGGNLLATLHNENIFLFLACEIAAN